MVYRIFGCLMMIAGTAVAEPAAPAKERFLANA